MCLRHFSALDTKAIVSMQQNNDFINLLRESKDARRVACILIHRDHILTTISMRHQMGARAEILTRNEEIEMFSPIPRRQRAQEYKQLHKITLIQ